MDRMELDIPHFGQNGFGGEQGCIDLIGESLGAKVKLVLGID